MNQLPVSKEMKAKIQPYFNETTNRYDIEAVREAMRSEFQSDDDPFGLSFTAALFFGGAMTEDEEPEQTMVSAAVQLNEELDHADAEVQNTDAIVADIVNWNMPADDKYGEKTINNRFQRLTEANQRIFVQKLLNVLDRIHTQDKAHNEAWQQWKSANPEMDVIQQSKTFNAQFTSEQKAQSSKRADINNRILYCFTNHLNLGHESGGNNDVQFTSINLSNAYRFVERGDATGETLEDLPEEYLASLGL